MIDDIDFSDDDDSLAMEVDSDDWALDTLSSSFSTNSSGTKKKNCRYLLILISFKIFRYLNIFSSIF